MRGTNYKINFAFTPEEYLEPTSMMEVLCGNS